MKKKFFVSLLLVSSLMIETAAGTTRKSTLKTIINTRANEIYGCFTKTYAEAESARGRVALKWAIDDKGVVNSIQLHEKQTTLRNSAMHRCIASQIRAMKFPKAPAGRTFLVSYNFNFSKS